MNGGIEMYFFEMGTRFLLDEKEFEVKRLSGQNLIVENLNYKRKEELAISDLLEKWQQNLLVFKNTSIDKKKDGVNKEVFSQLSEPKKEKAKLRYKQLKPVISGDVLPDELDDYLKKMNIGRTQFYVWKKKWETFPNIMSLVPENTGPKNRRTQKEVLEMIQELVDEFCYSGEKHTDKSLYNELKLRIAELNEYRLEKDRILSISMATFRREKKGILDTFMAEKEKLGSIEAKRRKEGTKKEVITTRPLQRVEIDWTDIDVMLINPDTGKPERPKLIYGIDKYTGYPLGFYVKFGGVDTAALKQCLLHIIMPKMYVGNLYPDVLNDWITYGIPEVIVLDNAKVNESLDLEDACLQLGIEIQYARIASGNQKGSIERAFRTLNQKYFHRMPGTTFSNIQEKGLYDSEGKACITLRTFINMAHLIFVDDIAQKHSEKRKGTPANLWKAAIEINPHLSFPLTQTVEELKLSLMSGLDYRTIQEPGVMIRGEYYYSTDLMKLRGKLLANYNQAKNVKVRYDLTDLREVYIWDEFEGHYITATQTGLERRGITNPEHILERKMDRLLSKNPDSETETLNEAIVSRKVSNLAKKDAKNLRMNKRKQESLEKRQKAENNTLVGISGVELAEDDENIVLVWSKNQEEIPPEPSGKKPKRTQQKKRKEKENEIQPEDDMKFSDLKVSSFGRGLGYEE
jgi:putative transposase